MQINYISSVDSINELTRTYNDISSIIRQFPNHHIIVGGEFNTSFQRPGHALYQLLSFMENEALKCCLFHSSSDIKFTFESKANSSRSTIDHFLLSEALFDNVVYVKLFMMETISLIITQCTSNLMHK